MSSQIPAPAPTYVAELSEYHGTPTDIPPLVRSTEFMSCINWDLQEHVVYSKEIQTTEGSFDVPQFSEDEIRQQITEEFEQREKQRLAQIEEEKKRAEQEKMEEYRGK